MSWVEKIIAEEPYGEGNDLKHFRYTGEEIVRCLDCKYRILSDHFYPGELLYKCKRLGFEASKLDRYCGWGEKKDERLDI